MWSVKEKGKQESDEEDTKTSFKSENIEATLRKIL
jgi:hypothetical protein